MDLCQTTVMNHSIIFVTVGFLHFFLVVLIFSKPDMKVSVSVHKNAILSFLFVCNYFLK